MAQITDVHLGPWIKPRHLREIVDHVNLLEPDVVALTGDYVGYRKWPLQACAEVFSYLESPTFAVLGNHDHWTDSELAARVFDDTPIDLLQNEARELEVDNAYAIRVAGVDDAVTKHHDPEKAHREHTHHPFTLTLNHVPDIADQCVEHGADVILSGHTHGLQFNVKGVSKRLAKLAKVKYVGGYYPIGQSHLYVCRGLGSASWPRRIDAHPEVAVVTIEHGESEMNEHGTRLVRLAR